MTERRYAIRKLCPSCRAPVVAGLDGPLAAIWVSADPAPIGSQGEALAQLAGRGTFELRRHGSRYTLLRRDRWQIGGRRGQASEVPGRAAADVLAEHRCGAAELPTVTSNFTRTASKEPRYAHPPF